MTLGQCLDDGVPLSAAWALRWLQAADAGWMPGGKPCSERELAAFFAVIYHERHGPGLLLPSETSCLLLNYRPASPTSEGALLNWVTRHTGLPDVLRDRETVRDLMEVAAELRRRQTARRHTPQRPLIRCPAWRRM